MCRNLLKKFIAQDDDVFIRFAKQSVLLSVVVPDPSFAEKIETRVMHNFGIRGQTVRPKENGRAECAFKRSNQSPILFASFAHAEGLQHFGSALELDRLTLLLDGHDADFSDTNVGALFRPTQECRINFWARLISIENTGFGLWLRPCYVDSQDVTETFSSTRGGTPRASLRLPFERLVFEGSSG